MMPKEKKRKRQSSTDLDVEDLNLGRSLPKLQIKKRPRTGDSDIFDTKKAFSSKKRLNILCREIPSQNVVHFLQQTHLGLEVKRRLKQVSGV